MNCDFTLEKYAQLCDTVKCSPHRIMTIKQYLEAGQPQEFTVVLRHDVDRALPKAIRMAELEAAHGIRATYYVRMTEGLFQPPALRHLRELGHEIGYHYEVLARAKGDLQQAIALFAQELKRFRQIVPVDTVSMHGSPLSRWNNLDLWQTYDFRAYDVEEAYLSIDYAELYYFTDTGRGWDAGRYNLRDHAPSRRPSERVRTTDELMDCLRTSPARSILINAHPNRWTTGWLAWGVSASSDWFINQAKWVISLVRRERR